MSENEVPLQSPSIFGRNRFREFDILKNLDHVGLTLLYVEYATNRLIAEHYPTRESILERSVTVWATNPHILDRS